LERFRPACTGNANEVDALFFVRLTGEPIKNPTKELDFLQAEFNLPSVTSSNARHVLETAKGNANLYADTRAGKLKTLQNLNVISFSSCHFTGNGLGGMWSG
jgi:hypothetical protein